MAYNDQIRLKLYLVDAWNQIMPTDTSTGMSVPVDYAWPGVHQKATHVWMPNQRTASQPGAMKAGRKRRDQTSSFDVVIEASLKGRTLDPSGRNVLQQEADQIVSDVAGLIDEWVADNPTLGQTATGMIPVDYATFDSFNSEGGPTTDGVRTVGICQITYRLRPL